MSNDENASKEMIYPRGPLERLNIGGVVTRSLLLTAVLTLIFGAFVE